MVARAIARAHRQWRRLANLHDRRRSHCTWGLQRMELATGSDEFDPLSRRPPFAFLEATCSTRHSDRNFRRTFRGAGRSNKRL